MYYVIAKNSENKKTYVSTFKEKREAVSNIAFRFKKKLNSLNSSKHDIKNVETCWDCDEIYEELLDQNYDQLSESEINDEILFGNADVDFVLDGTFGKGVLKKQHYDFSISYLKTNDRQMFITDAHWN